MVLNERLFDSVKNLTRRARNSDDEEENNENNEGHAEEHHGAFTGTEVYGAFYVNTNCQQFHITPYELNNCFGKHGSPEVPYICLNTFPIPVYGGVSVPPAPGSPYATILIGNPSEDFFFEADTVLGTPVIYLTGSAAGTPAGTTGIVGKPTITCSAAPVSCINERVARYPTICTPVNTLGDDAIVYFSSKGRQPDGCADESGCCHVVYESCDEDSDKRKNQVKSEARTEVRTEVKPAFTPKKDVSSPKKVEEKKSEPAKVAPIKN